MRTVWWFPIKFEQRSVTMPTGSKPLYVSMRQGQPVFYALVNPKLPEVEYAMQVVATGQEFNAHAMAPVGVFEPEPNFFFHLFIAL